MPPLGICSEVGELARFGVGGRGIGFISGAIWVGMDCVCITGDVSEPGVGCGFWTGKGCPVG